MQTMLISAETARNIYLENKDKYPERRKIFIENEVYNAIKNSVETNPHEFGVLLNSDIFQDFPTRYDIENQLRDLGYLVCNQHDSTYISWTLSYYKPCRISHRCIESAESQYKKCIELMQKKHNEKIEQILSEINFRIDQELKCGTYGKKTSLNIDEKILQYITPILREKKYSLAVKTIKNSSDIKITISW